MTEISIILAITIGIAFYFAARTFKSTPNHEWVPIHSLKKKKLIDGTTLSGPLMTRTINGIAQYRRMSDDEYSDAIIDQW
ncbi:hypothetical protein AYJ56_08640 [Brucella anthropi]|nr:hypothetical protein AYJ56_08640 [Brucella anthropi]